MMVISPRDIKWLTLEEAEKYGLFGHDLLKEESDTLYYMRRYNLSRDEFQRRREMGLKCGGKVKRDQSEPVIKHLERLEACIQEVLRTGQL
jgi:hypothetical protein